LGSIGGAELVFVLVLALLLFGPRQLPKIGRTIGKTLGDLRKATTDFKMNLENGRTLYEIPASTYRLLGRNVPVAGGGFLRHSPYWYSSRVIRRMNNNNQPAVVYLHPWEIDSDTPRVKGLTFLQHYRTYGSTSVFYYKLDKLLRDFSFTSISDYLRRFRKKRSIGFHSR